MECDRYKEEMILRLYGEPGAEAPGFDEHLASCATCREEMDEMDEVSLLYNEASREPLPLKLRNRLLQERTSQGRWLHYTAAGFVAAFLLGFLVWPTRTQIEAVPPLGEVDYELNEIVIQLTPEEVAWAVKYEDAPMSWDESSFGTPSMKRISNRMEEVLSRTWYEVER